MESAMFSMIDLPTCGSDNDGGDHGNDRFLVTWNLPTCGSDNAGGDNSDDIFSDLKVSRVKAEPHTFSLHLGNKMILKSALASSWLSS